MFQTPCLRRLRAAALIAALCMLAGAAQADPLRLSLVQNLSFGAFGAGSSGGSVVLSPSGARSASGSVTLLSNGPGSPAQFLVTGNAGQVYTITLPSSATLSGNGTSMTMSNFVSSPSAASASTGLLTGGSQTLSVGARLSVGANQAQGSYSGTFSVTVNNN